MSFLSAWNSILNVFKKGDSISESIYNSVLIIMLVGCTGFPVLSWIDTPKFVQYLHKWEQFQVGSNSSSCNSLLIEKFVFYFLSQHYEV
jgi:hypothetical protein